MMKKLFVLIVWLALAVPAFAQVNGHVETVDDKTVLTVWGTHQERGYAHGYLLGEEAKQIFDEYIIAYVCFGQQFIYNNMRTFFVDNYDVQENYDVEINALFQGMIDAGVELYNEDLGRDVDATDILVANAIVDLSQIITNLRPTHMGCSSLSSWGISTEQDSLLSGDLIITRMMDWDTHSALTENHLMMVSIPSEPDEQHWLSLTFPSFLGCLSGINENGMTVTLNVGNITTYDSGEMFYPILFTLREGFESADYNEDGVNDYSDIVNAIQDKNRSAGTIIHVTQNDDYNSYPIIIESNNVAGVAVRDTSGNSESPLINGDNLVATNHFRTLYDPEWCYRYQGIADSLENSHDITPARSWGIMCDAAGLSWNLHTLQYVKSADLLYWSTATSTVPGYQNEPTLFHPAKLMGVDSGENILTLPTFSAYETYGTFDFNLANEDSIAFGQFCFTYHELSYFEIQDVVTTERTEGFEVDWDSEDVEDKTIVSVVFQDTSGTSISPGDGGILTFHWTCSASCIPDTSTMHFTEDFLFAPDFSYRESETEDGFFYIQTGWVEDTDISSPPANHQLFQNYPNPFNPNTTINFALPENAQVRLKVYDTSGKLINVLVNAEKEAGYHSVIWDGTDELGQEVASGIYFFQIESRDFTQLKKCLLLK